MRGIENPMYGPNGEPNTKTARIFLSFTFLLFHFPNRSPRESKRVARATRRLSDLLSPRMAMVDSARNGTNAVWRSIEQTRSRASNAAE